MLKKKCDILSIRYDEELCFQSICNKKTGDCIVLNDGKNKVVIACVGWIQYRSNAISNKTK